MHDKKCDHKKCWEHRNYPQFHSKTKSISVNDRTDFTSFKRVRWGRYVYIVPVNPFSSSSAERSLFKKFERLSRLEVFGDWPDDRDIFDRSEVDIQFVKYAAFKNKCNSETGKSERSWYIDVKEAAVYSADNSQ